MTKATSRGNVLGVRRWAHVVDLGSRVDHAGVDQHAAGGVVDCPDEHGHLFALHDEVRCEVGADHGHHSPLGESLVCKDPLKSRPYTSSDSVQCANSSVFVGEEAISPETFAGAIAQLVVAPDKGGDLRTSSTKRSALDERDKGEESRQSVARGCSIP
jgi:hypothetical protein